jgi:hypothetical protein
LAEKLARLDSVSDSCEEEKDGDGDGGSDGDDNDISTDETKG